MHNPRTPLGGSITALASPFRDGRLDEATLAAMVERQIIHATSALVASGSTGEAAMLSLSEHVRLIRLATAVSAGRVPVIAGCTASATDTACGLAVAAARAGANALLLAPPPYVKPTQPGIIAHVRAVARAADLPVVLYDIPSRVGVAIADATIATLYHDGIVIALKDATGDLTRPSRLRALCGPELRLLTGEDSQALAFRAMGGDGCISVTANLAPRLCAQLHQSWDAGDLHTARAIAASLAPLHAALFLESNPIPVKAALAAIGLGQDTMRAPLTPATEETRSALKAALVDVMAHERALTHPCQRPFLQLAG